MMSRLVIGLAALLALPAAAPVPQAELVGAYGWTDPDDGFGGFSAIELAPDGLGMTALSDRGQVWQGRLLRDANGVIEGVSTTARARLRDSDGNVLRVGRLADAEGLAIAPDGTLAVSYEGLVRVALYDTIDAPARPLPRLPAFKTLPENAALEALAMDPEGALVTLPEAPVDGAHPIWRFAQNHWSEVARLPADPPWAPVAADYGPDGRFYLLERNFLGLRGFASRVRRFEADFTAGAVVLETSPRTHDNLEGLSVWRDEGGALRLTMISDDNFNFFQSTEIVEYRLAD